MKHLLPILSAALIAGTASPAFADSSFELHDIIAPSSAPVIHPVDLPFSSYDLADQSNGDRQFVATLTEQFQPGYRLQAESQAIETENAVDALGLIFPGELAFRLRAQTTGVDSVVPNHFLSSSVRSDYPAESGPAAIDKGAVGISIGF